IASSQNTPTKTNAGPRPHRNRCGTTAVVTEVQVAFMNMAGVQSQTRPEYTTVRFRPSQKIPAGIT
ncbi:MAG: hypothetical protein LW697_01245, partial [Blastopirellula sp.]|nr:hypothetical protein [Blastopirellula sp.]